MRSRELLFGLIVGVCLNGILGLATGDNPFVTKAEELGTASRVDPELNELWHVSMEEGGYGGMRSNYYSHGSYGSASGTEQILGRVRCQNGLEIPVVDDPADIEDPEDGYMVIYGLSNSALAAEDRTAEGVPKIVVREDWVEKVAGVLRITTDVTDERLWASEITLPTDVVFMARWQDANGVVWRCETQDMPLSSG